VEGRALPGDKVRLRVPPGGRGVVVAHHGDSIVVETDRGPFECVSSELTNYSLAARRAWATRPKRAGRPALARPRKRPISVRIDVDLLAAIAVLAEDGVIENRERSINHWIREGIHRLKGRASVPVDVK
jgi:hypothetical protein